MGHNNRITETINKSKDMKKNEVNNPTQIREGTCMDGDTNVTVKTVKGFELNLHHMNLVRENKLKAKILVYDVFKDFKYTEIKE